MTRLNKVALSISTLLALVAAGFEADLNKSEWAAWVQAIGAIAAIVGAVFVVFVQLQHADDARRRAEVVAEAASIETSRRIAAFSCDVLATLEKHVRDASPSGVLDMFRFRADLEAVSTGWRNAIKRDLADPRLTKSALSCYALVRSIESAWLAEAEEIKRNPEAQKVFADYAALIIQRLQGHERLYVTVLTENYQADAEGIRVRDGSFQDSTLSHPDVLWQEPEVHHSQRP